MALFDAKGNPIGPVASSGPEAPVLVEGANKAIGSTLPKLMGAPVNLAEFGKQGIQKAVGGDTEGIFNRMITNFKGPQGGILANLIAKIFDKEGLMRNIGSLEWANADWSQLGGISPSATGGQVAALDVGGPDLT